MVADDNSPVIYSPNKVWSATSKSFVDIPSRYNRGISASGRAARRLANTPCSGIFIG